MSTLVNIDKRWFDCTSIDTETWLDAVTDCDVTETIDNNYPTEKLHGDDTYNHPFWGSDFDRETLARIARAQFGIDFDPDSESPRDNTYNNENSLSADFVFEIFHDHDAPDWLYSRCLIAINLHLGGDPRGNYGAVRWFIVDCPAESGFCDWGLDLYITYASGDNADEEGRYTSAPEYAFKNDARVVGYSEKRKAWLAWFNGRAVAVDFEARASYY